MSEVDAKLLRQALEYFPETGIFIWKISPAKNVFAGSVAGCYNNKGYWRICYYGRSYMAHRVAWLLMTGEWPSQQIDHRNLDKYDNRWCNLRLATAEQNMANRRTQGAILKGVSIDKRDGKFQALIGVNRKSLYLGRFNTAEEAHAAYVMASKKYHGEFGRAI